MPCDHNPFSTRHIRPGAIPFLFCGETSITELSRVLQSQAYWGQIVGPHGSGKSTLLHSLAAQLRESGRTVEWFSLRAGEHRLALQRNQVLQWTATTQVIVDGYEQLPWWRRWTLERACRRRQAGLLVTTHHPLRLPTLWITKPTSQVARAIVDHLLTDEQTTILSPTLNQDWETLWCQHDGNIRELLFDLYDRYESPHFSLPKGG